MKRPADSPIRTGVGAPEHSSLSRAAAKLLESGPRTSAEIVAEICHIPATPSMVADEIAAALLAAAPFVSRLADGRWSLAEPDMAAHPASQTPHASRSALRQLRYLVVDVETTGLSPDYGHRITEVAAFVVQDGEITPVMNTLINPERPIPPFITSLTGISTDMVRSAPRFSEVCEGLWTELGSSVFVAHNAAFDWNFVSSELLRARGELPGAHQLCTVKMARAFLPGLRRRSLDHVAGHFGVRIEGRHRAGGDALATAHVLMGLLELASCAGMTCWDDLASLMRSTSSKGRAASRRRPPSDTEC